MQSKRAVIEIWIPPTHICPTYLLRVEFIHAKILATLPNKHSTLLCKVDMEETHKLRVTLKNLSLMRNLPAIANQQFFRRKWAREPCPGQLVQPGRTDTHRVGPIFIWTILDGQIILRTSSDVFIFNLGLRFEGSFSKRYILKGQIAFEEHWRLQYGTLIAMTDKHGGRVIQFILFDVGESILSLGCIISWLGELPHAPITLDFPRFSVRFEPWNCWGICLRNRCWPTIFHTITAGDAEGWYLNWPVYQPLTQFNILRFVGLLILGCNSFQVPRLEKKCTPVRGFFFPSPLCFDAICVWCGGLQGSSGFSSGFVWLHLLCCNFFLTRWV